jgi:hypothetical protein
MELANQQKAALRDLRRSTERLLRDWDKKIPFLAEQQQAIRDLKGEVSSKMASLEQKGRTDSHLRQASLLEKEVMRNQEHNQREKFDGGHPYSSSPFANVGYTPRQSRPSLGISSR